jgi:hypothetical protein
VVADVRKGEITPKELLIKGGHVVTVDPDPGDLPAGDVLVETASSLPSARI